MLIATTKQLIVYAVSHKLEFITAWENPDTTFTKHHIRPNTENPVEVSSYETLEELADSLELHAWLLQGIRSKKVEELIQKQI